MPTTYTPSQMAAAIRRLSGGDGGAVTEVYMTPSSTDVPEGSVYIYMSHERVENTKPICATPMAGIAGQNSNTAINALNATGSYDGSSYNWTTSDYDYNDLWIGADFGDAMVLNSMAVAVRTWNGRRQIYTVIFEASNDASTWVELGVAAKKGNDIPQKEWFLFGTDNTTAYRYYRLRTEIGAGSTINGSVTFTIYGLGFLNQQDILGPARAYYKKDGTLYRFDITS